jgi:uncharacterized protein
VDTRICVSLPVKDLFKSVEFFSKLGFNFDNQHTDEKAACMIIGEEIFVMLVAEDERPSFASRKVYDALRSTQAHMVMS